MNHNHFFMVQRCTAEGKWMPAPSLTSGIRLRPPNITKAPAQVRGKNLKMMGRTQAVFQGRRRSGQIATMQGLLLALSTFANFEDDLFPVVPDSLALVGLWGTLLAHIGTELPNVLIVDARDDQLGVLLDHH